MATYVEEILTKFKETNIIENDVNIAIALRMKLGEDKLIKIFNSLWHEEDFKSEFVNKDTEYGYYWLAAKMIEMDKAEPADDGIKYPSHNWVNGELWYPLLTVTEALNSLNGVTASKGLVYRDGSCYRSKGFWTIDFDSIEDFNHFLWAACYRYIPLAKSDEWRLLPNLGDPDYNEHRLRFELHYMMLNATKEEMEKDFVKMAKHIEAYSNDENEIKERLTK